MCNWLLFIILYHEPILFVLLSLYCLLLLFMLSYGFFCLIFTFLKSHFANRWRCTLSLRQLSILLFIQTHWQTHTHTHAYKYWTIAMRKHICLLALLCCYCCCWLRCFYCIYFCTSFGYCAVAPGKYSCHLMAAMTFFIALLLLLLRFLLFLLLSFPHLALELYLRAFPCHSLTLRLPHLAHNTPNVDTYVCKYVYISVCIYVYVDGSMCSCLYIHNFCWKVNRSNTYLHSAPTDSSLWIVCHLPLAAWRLPLTITTRASLRNSVQVHPLL